MSFFLKEILLMFQFFYGHLVFKWVCVAWKIKLNLKKYLCEDINELFLKKSFWFLNFYYEHLVFKWASAAQKMI